MITCKNYLEPEIEIVLLGTEDVIRTSGDKGELPFQPFGTDGGSIFG